MSNSLLPNALPYKDMMIAQLPISEIINEQRTFFSTGKTKDIIFRIEQLKILKQVILEHKENILNGLAADLNKPIFESYLSELLVLKEIDYAIKNIKSWAKPRKVVTPIEQFPSSGCIYPEPLGVVLIISAWNYPFNLIIAPLIGAIAAGNCAILKPSEIAPHTSKILVDIFQKNFDPAYIAMIEGGIETNQQLLKEKFDHIFFTGGTTVGKIVMAAAAEHLTPVTLELGGKSPCMVDSDVQIEYTARRITWGKFLNAGQSCVAPDYLLVDQSIKQELLNAIKKCLQEFYGNDAAKSPDYARIINQKQFDRLKSYLTDGDIIIGGQSNAEDNYIAPTVIDNVSLDAPIMQSEIFGPILPVITYNNLTEAISLINERPKPLAIYLFSRNPDRQQRILRETSSGGVCINETMMHFGVATLPFGGVGNSGIGSYHGKASFDTFSHYKSVLENSFIMDIKLRYPPYKGKLNLLKLILGIN